MKLYEHASSGNCLKCRLVLRRLELPYESVSVDLFRGETRTPEHFGRNPDGRIPVLETDNGEIHGIETSLRAGWLRAVALTASSYTTGQSVTWLQTRDDSCIETWERPQRKSVTCAA